MSRALRAALRTATCPARGRWLRPTPLRAIGAAYGAFGDLDAAINGLPGGLRAASSPTSPACTGSSSRCGSAARPATRRRTRGGSSPTSRSCARNPAASEIEPLDYALRAHEVLEDAPPPAPVRQPRAAPRCRARANVEGTRVVLARWARSPAATQASSCRRSAALGASAPWTRGVSGPRRLPRWDAVSQATATDRRSDRGGGRAPGLRARPRRSAPAAPRQRRSGPADEPQPRGCSTGVAAARARRRSTACIGPGGQRRPGRRAGDALGAANPLRGRPPGRILTPRPRHAIVISFDLIAPSRAEPAEALRVLSDARGALTAGHPPLLGSPGEGPTPDTGVLGLRVRPTR